MNIRKILKNLDQLPIVEDYKKAIGCLCDYRHLPISPSMIEDDKTLVVFSKSATKDYHLLVQTAKNDLAELDYPFAILGNRKQLENESIIMLERFVFCCDTRKMLTKRKATIDSTKLLDAIDDSSYNIIIWGRTHGIRQKNKKVKSEHSLLNEEYKEKYNIREEELNIKLEELDEYSAISSVVSTIDLEKETYQMIIMPTGEVVMLGVTDGKYHKFPNIEIFTGKDMEEVPVESFDTKFLSGMKKSKRGK